MYHNTSHGPPVTISVSNQPFGYAEYSAYTNHPQGTKTVIIKYELGVVVADGVNVYVDSRTLSTADTLVFL